MPTNTNDMYDFLLNKAKVDAYQAMQGLKTLQTERRGFSYHPIEDKIYLEKVKEEFLAAVAAGAESYIYSFLDQHDKEEDDFTDVAGNE